MNALIRIWREPTAVIIDSLNRYSLGLILVLVAMSSAVSGLLGLASNGADFAVWLMVLVGIIGSVIAGIIGWYWNSIWYLLFGKLLGGKGRYGEVLRATAPALFPAVILLPFPVIGILLYGKDYFSKPVDELAMTNLPLPFYVTFMLVSAVVGIYSIVVLSKGVGIAHQFSALRGFATVCIYGFLTFLLVLAIIFVVVIVFVAVAPS